MVEARKERKALRGDVPKNNQKVKLEETFSESGRGKVHSYIPDDPNERNLDLQLIKEIMMEE